MYTYYSGCALERIYPQGHGKILPLSILYSLYFSSSGMSLFVRLFHRSIRLFFFFRGARACVCVPCRRSFYHFIPFTLYRFSRYLRAPLSLPPPFTLIPSVSL